SNVQTPTVDPLKYTAQSLTGSKDLLTVKIRYKKPGDDSSILLSETIKYNHRNATENLWFASSVAEFGMLLRESEFKGQSSFAQVVQRAKESKGSDEFGYKDEFIRLVQMAEMLYR
ncbi:MAG TPA: DUF3520 domain-containing protein, partial [Tenuifilaceae bacterium]|nr:DUF3520 domain-containing protein [Tenuifilaceae bacterium]